MTDVITVSDESSDEEIVFFPAEPSKPKVAEREDYGDEVIYCGIKKASTDQSESRDPSKRRNRVLPSIGKDVTVVSNVVRRNVDSPQQSDVDVQYLGFRKRQNDTNTSTPGATSMVPAVRGRSDSVNININSQKSLKNTNLTINIEDDTETNKKKVQLTFLGPSNRNRSNESGPSNMKNTNFNFKPSAASTPRTKIAKFSNNVRPRFNSNNQITPVPFAKQQEIRRAPLNVGRMGTAGTNSFTKISPNLNLKSAPSFKNAPKTPSNSSTQNINRNSNNILKNQNNQTPNNIKIKSLLKPTIPIKNKETNIVQRNKKQSVKTKSVEKPTETSNSPILKTLATIKPPINASCEIPPKDPPNTSKREELKKPSKEPLSTSKCEGLKKPSKEPLNTSKCEELKKPSKEPLSTSKREELKKPSKEPLNTSKCEELKKPSKKPPRTSQHEELKKSRPSEYKPNDKEPVAGPSGLKCAKATLADPASSDSSSEDESTRNNGKEDGLSDSSEYGRLTKPSISKSDLDSLFNKVLANCIKTNKSVPVLKMKSKLNKLYLNSKNLTSNEAFILLLKEVSLRVESKPVRNPLEIMKKVLINLRKDSPSNQRNIEKLEKALSEISKKIKQFEEAEVTSDEDENDSAYVKLDKYRKRAVEIYNKLCELNSVPADAERSTLRNVTFHGKVPREFSKSTSIQNLVTRVSRALEKYYNKSRKFPDFQDVRLLMGKLCNEGGFKLKSETVYQLARSLFEEFGDMLQKRRLYDEYQVCNEYLGVDDEDPYYFDPILAAKLDANQKNRRKEKDVLQRYTLKQTTLNEDGFSSDSSSCSSSECESDQDRKEKKSRESKSTKRDSSDDSNSEDSDNSDTEPSSNKRKKEQSSDSSCDSSDDDRKIQKSKKSKQDHSDDEIHKEASNNNKTDKALNESNNKKKRRLSNESDCDDSRNYKHLKNDENVSRDIDSAKETSNTEDVTADLSNQTYENATTVDIDDKSDPVNSIVDTDNQEDNLKENESANDEIQQDIRDVEDNDEMCLVIDEDAVSTVEVGNIRNQEIASIADSPSIVILDDDDSSEEPEILNTNSENNNTSEQNNSSGLMITNVMSCKESFSSQDQVKEVVIQQDICPPTIDLLSDDEEQTRQSSGNVLSQEEVLELIPIIFGRSQ